MSPDQNNSDQNEIDLVELERSELGRRLADAMHAQADRFEPRPDSYVRLQQAASRASEARPVLTTSRVLAAAAAIVIIAGAGAWLFSRSTGQQIETATPTTAEATTTTPTTTPPETTVVDTTVAESVTTTTEAEPFVDGLVAGPRRLTRQEAAEAFLSLIRVPYAEVEIEGDTAHVVSYDPDGDVGGRVAELELAAVPMFTGEPGHAVMRATTGAVTIDTPTAGQLIEATSTTDIAVTGQGTGFEGAVGVRLISAFDGTLLDRQADTAGNFGELAPYEVQLMVTGRDHGWIVAESGVGADVTAPFAAVPIEWDAGLDPTEYVATHIPADDADGGLNLRNLPGIDEGEVLDTLPAGTTGIRRRGRVPAFVGDEVWWAVTTDDGQEGWVNSRYLARVGPVSANELAQVAASFLSGLDSGGFTGMSAVPWSTGKPISFGWFGGLESFAASELADPEFWQTSREWAVPEERYSSPVQTASPRTFLGVPSPFQMNVAERPGDRPWGQGVVIAAVESEFAGLASVTIESPGGDVDIDDRTTTLFVEPTPEGPRIVGVAVWIWIP